MDKFLLAVSFCSTDGLLVRSIVCGLILCQQRRDKDDVVCVGQVPEKRGSQLPT